MTNASEYLRRVNAALALREIPDHPAALEQLNKAIELASEDASIYLLLGLTYQDLGEWDKAEVSFRRAVEIQPDLREAQQSLGLSLVQNKKFQEAIPVLEPIAEIDPANQLVHKALAKAYEEQNRVDEAIKIFQKALSVYPDDASLQRQISVLLFKYPNLDHAKEILGQILEVAQSANLWNTLGLFEIRTKNYTAATEYFSRALNLDEKYTPAWSNLTGIYLDLGEIDHALETAEVGLEKDPENLHLIARKAEALSIKGDVEKSLEIYTQAIQKAINKDKFIFDILIIGQAMVYFKHFGPDPALQHIRQMLEQYPKSKKLIDLEISILIDSGRYDEARLTFEQSMPDEILDLSHIQIYITALQGSGNFEKAEQYLQDYYDQLEQPTKRTELLDRVENVGVLLYKSGQVEGSERIFKQVLQLEPKSARSLNNLAFIMISERQWEAALELLSRAEAQKFDSTAILKTNQGYIEVNLGKLEKALQTFLIALQIVNEDEQAILHVAYPWSGGLAQLPTDDFPTRMVHVKTSIIANLATTYYLLGEKDQAFDAVDKAIHQDPEESAGYRILGCFYFLNGQPDQACQSWRQALKSKASNAEKEVIKTWMSELPINCEQKE